MAAGVLVLQGLLGHQSGVWQVPHMPEVGTMTAGGLTHVWADALAL